MKKLIALLLAMAMLFSMAACGKNNDIRFRTKTCSPPVTKRPQTPMSLQPVS